MVDKYILFQSNRFQIIYQLKPIFHRIHVAPATEITDYMWHLHTDSVTYGQTEDGQSDPCASLHWRHKN